MKKGEGKRSTLMIGMEGEMIARQYVEELGFEILETNWRYKHQEIDIIAAAGKILHIIEVKTQLNDHGGLPEENVDRKKIMNLMKAAEAYMLTHEGWTTIQFDVLSILLKKGEPEILWIEDVFL